FLPARSLAQPRDSTRVVPAVPCCRSQPHCSSGSRGRDGKTAWALAAGCRWTPEASGRAAQRRARATGAPAPADRPALARGAPGPAGVRATGPQASALPSKAAPARVGTPTPLAGGAWAKPRRMGMNISPSVDFQAPQTAVRCHTCGTTQRAN
ncbi:unnamed protein product, partial [Prorocentrum cordatum]